MNANSKVTLLQQAQAAQARGNWLLLLQCLQQLIEESQSEQILELALEVLLEGDFQERWEIAKLFPKLGEKAIAPLIEILQDEETEEELCWFAVRILGEFKRADVINTLVELLKTSEHEELTAIASEALGKIGTRAIESLTELLAAENTRLLAVRSLAYIRHSATIAPLLSVVEDPQISIRAAAVEALSSFHTPQITPILLKSLNDIAAPVRREAVTGLSFRPDLQAEFDLVNLLIPRLYDFNIDVCMSAAIALGRFGTDTAASALFQVLQSPHTPVILQIEIVRALGRIETKTALEYLSQALNQQLSATVYQEIATVLGRIAQPELKALAADILIEMVKKTQSHHINSAKPCGRASAIALSLGQLGEIQALPALIELLAEHDVGVKLHTITALKKLAPTTAYQRLQEMATNTSLPLNLQQGVAIALHEWSKTEV